MADWTEYVIYNMPLEEESAWASLGAEGWVDVWKPRRLLNLRIRFEHSTWQRVVQEEEAAQARRRFADEVQRALWTGSVSGDGSEDGRWLIDPYDVDVEGDGDAATNGLEASRERVQMPGLCHGGERTSLRGRGEWDVGSSGLSS